MAQTSFGEKLVEKGQEIRWDFAQLLSLSVNPITKSDSGAYRRATWRRVPKTESIGGVDYLDLVGSDPEVTSQLKDKLKGPLKNATVLGVMADEIDRFSSKFPELEQGVLIKSGEYKRAAVVPGGFGRVAIAGYEHYAVALREGANDFYAAPVLTNSLTREVFVPETTVVVERSVPNMGLPTIHPGVPLV